MEDNTIAKAYVQIIPTTKGIKGQLEKEFGGDEVGQKAGKSIAGGIGKGLAKSVGLIATGVTAVSGVIVKGVKDTAEYADNIDKMSQKLGLSAGAYQEWDFIAQHSGTSIDGLQASMKTLANAAQDGKDAFEKIGLSVSDVQKMSQEDLFATVVDRLQSMGESTERTAIASDLLGRSATELAPLLNTSAAATAEMRQQAHDLGAVLSDEAVKSGAQFQDSLQNLQASFGGLKNSLSAQFLPAIVDVMDGITALVTGDEGGIEQINKGVDAFLSNMLDSIPKVVENVTTIMMRLVDTIVSNLPKIIDSGITIVLKLAEGIGNALPKLIDKVPQIITGIVTTLSNNIPKIIETGLTLVVNLAAGLIKAIPQMVKQLPQIISAIVSGLASGIGSMAEVGLNLVKGLWNGISDAAGWVLDKIRGFGQSILNGIKNIFGIHSPSREMAWMGKMLDMGLAKGINDNGKFVDRAIGELTDNTLGGFNPTINGQLNTTAINNNAAVIDAINRVGGMMNMGIYLDGNQLVGGIKNRMDNALGQNARTNARLSMG